MSTSSERNAIHQHPLGYLLGLEGVALLRAFAGEHDREFTQARIREIRDLIDRADEFGAGTGRTRSETVHRATPALTVHLAHGGHASWRVVGLASKGRTWPSGRSEGHRTDADVVWRCAP